MAQAYSDPKRASEPNALPDVDVFEHVCSSADGEACDGPGWYWWPCFPGCLPDGNPVGPFATEAEALADAQSNSEDDNGE